MRDRCRLFVPDKNQTHSDQINEDHLNGEGQKHSHTHKRVCTQPHTCVHDYHFCHCVCGHIRTCVDGTTHCCTTTHTSVDTTTHGCIQLCPCVPHRHVRLPVCTCVHKYVQEHTTTQTCMYNYTGRHQPERPRSGSWTPKVLCKGQGRALPAMNDTEAALYVGLIDLAPLRVGGP